VFVSLVFTDHPNDKFDVHKNLQVIFGFDQEVFEHECMNVLTWNMDRILFYFDLNSVNSEKVFGSLTFKLLLSTRKKNLNCVVILRETLISDKVYNDFEFASLFELVLVDSNIKDVERLGVIGQSYFLCYVDEFIDDLFVRHMDTVNNCCLFLLFTEYSTVKR